MAKTVGMVTIGQSPRVDVVPEMARILGPDVRIVEAGALDGLTPDQVEALRPRDGDHTLVTRLADGTSVTLGERLILPLMQERIHELSRRGAEVIALLCTGEFPPFSCDGLLVRTQPVIFDVVRSLASGLRLGVLIPLKEQVADAEKRWIPAAREVVVEYGSPYGDPAEIEIAARRLARRGAEIVVMDCMGYTLGMKETVKRFVPRPVVLSRSILARILAELVS